MWGEREDIQHKTVECRLYNTVHTIASAIHPPCSRGILQIATLVLILSLRKDWLVDILVACSVECIHDEE